MKTFLEEVSPGKKIEKVLDYSQGLNDLPKSDVLKYLLEGHCLVVVRPSGTEPKLKVYVSVSAESQTAAEEEKVKVICIMKTFLCEIISA